MLDFAPEALSHHAPAGDRPGDRGARALDLHDGRRRRPTRAALARELLGRRRQPWTGLMSAAAASRRRGRAARPRASRLRCARLKGALGIAAVPARLAGLGAAGRASSRTSIPSPTDVWRAFVELIRKGILPVYFADSLGRYAAGVAIGAMLGDRARPADRPQPHAPPHRSSPLHQFPVRDRRGRVDPDLRRSGAATGSRRSCRADLRRLLPGALQHAGRRAHRAAGLINAMRSLGGKPAGRCCAGDPAAALPGIITGLARRRRLRVPRPGVRGDHRGQDRHRLSDLRGRDQSADGAHHRRHDRDGPALARDRQCLPASRSSARRSSAGARSTDARSSANERRAHRARRTALLGSAAVPARR